MKCERRLFEPEHIVGLPLKPIFLEGSIENALSIHGRPGAFTETIFCGEQAIAVIGLVLIWPGVATAWSLTTTKLQLAPKGFHCQVLEALEYYAQELSLWRIQMNVMAKFQKNVKWAEALGFSNEGRMVKFDLNKDDYFRFARIF